MAELGDIVKEYLRKYQNHSDVAIARILMKEHPLLFSSNLQSVRSIVRYHAGRRASVKYGGPRYKVKEPVIKENDITRETPHGIPDSYAVKREPFILPLVCNNILWISDLHIPYHIVEAVECALEYGKREKVNTIVIGGDLIDFHKISRFEIDPTKRDVKHEIEAAEQFLSYLRKSFPKASIYYMLGNHDIRWERWVRSKPEIFGDPYFDLETRLNCSKHRVTVIEDKQLVKAGKLLLHHGHYIFKGRSSPVSPAHTIAAKIKQSMMCGHTHKVTETTKTTGEGHIFTCVSVGCLCELLPDYDPIAGVNENAHGFAHIKVKPSGNFILRNYRVKDGDIL